MDVRARAPLSMLAAIASLVLVGGVVLAGSIPGPDGVIHGCYDKQGDVKVVASLPCPKGYTVLEWNQTGPSGPAGVSGYEIVRAVPDGQGDGNTTIHFHIDCPTGKKVAGGGGFATNITHGKEIVLARSYPSYNGGRWEVAFMNSDGSEFPTTDEVQADLSAVCITAD
jgi:hypothetical protein